MNTLEQLIAKSNTVKAILSNNGIVLGEDILIKVNGMGMDIELTSDKFSKRVFGSNVGVYGHRDFGSNKRRIELNVGSLGSFTPDCAASMAKINTQFSIVSNWDKFCQIASALMDEAEAQDKLAFMISKQN